MSGNSDALKKALRAVESKADDDLQEQRARLFPPGWAAGLSWDGTSGSVVTPPLLEPPTIDAWDEYLRRYGLDPVDYMVDPKSVQFTARDTVTKNGDGDPVSRTYFAFRAVIKPKVAAEVPPPDYEELYKETRAIKSSKPKKAQGEDTDIICLSDWQVGFGGQGTSAEDQIEKIAALPEKVAERIALSRENGCGEFIIAGMGDLHEQCSNFYSYQEFQVQLDRREQMKVVRRGIRDVILAALEEAPVLTVTAVGGNHGEQRTKGLNRQTTGRNDNDDVAVFEAVCEIVGDRKNLQFRLPTNRIAISLPAGPHIVGFTHGHVPKPKGLAINTMWEWWADQAMGRHFPGIADADVMFAGHFHHYCAKEQLGRALFICPSLVQASDYYGETNGTLTRPGTLAVTLSADGWHNQDIL